MNSGQSASQAGPDTAGHERLQGELRREPMDLGEPRHMVVHGQRATGIKDCRPWPSRLQDFAQLFGDQAVCPQAAVIGGPSDGDAVASELGCREKILGTARAIEQVNGAGVPAAIQEPDNQLAERRNADATSHE